ncbi:MAG: hypothetical protein ACFFAH_04590 [Promethearchaeota archaeon]
MWADYDYDIRLFEKILAFPLLKKLTEAGDPKAKLKFKDEITLRFEERIDFIHMFLINQGYLKHFTKFRTLILI